MAWVDLTAQRGQLHQKAGRDTVLDVKYIAANPPADRQTKKGHDDLRVLDKWTPAAGKSAVRKRSPKDGGEIRERKDKESVEVPRFGQMTVQQGVHGTLVAARGARQTGQQMEGTARHPRSLHRGKRPIESHRRNAGQRRDNPQNGLRTAV